MDEPEQIIKQQLANLPQDIRQVIQGNDWNAKIIDIADSHHLHVDQAGLLENEILLLLLGLERSESLVDNLVNEVKLSRDDASMIVGEINEKILLPIRESLKKITEEAPAEPVPAAPVPPTKSIFEAKMGGVHATPQQTVDLNQPTDPYRELPR